MNRISHYLPAPKPPLPNHVESYNPPVEYLFDEKEEEEWKNLDPEDRRINFIPQRFAHLRSVPAYENFIKERYQRCCELYLCPRVRKLKANIEKATDLLPHLPKPSDLRPFPINLAIVFQGHTGPVNCLDMSPPTSANASPGRYLCSGSADCTVKIWESCTGRCLRTIDISVANPSLKSPITSVSWYPTKSYDYNYPMIAFSAGKYAFVCALPKLIIGNDFKKMDAFYTSLLGKEGEEVTANKTTPQNQIVTENESAVDQIEGDNNDEVKPVEDDNDMKKNIEKKFIVTWIKPTQRMKDLGILFILKHPKDVTKVEWHRGGDYLLTVCAKSGSESIIFNKISKKQSQAPFSKVKGIIQTAAFHPKAPILFVATQKYVKVYHLVQKKLSKILITSCKWVSSLAIHPSGDNLIVGTYDNRVVWFDLDLSVKPFKILKFHHTSVKAVAFHPKLPLFASASEDCSLVISHGMVYNDYTRNPLIVPVKILRGGHSKVTGGILCCIFHPRQPWIFSCGADSKIALYSY